MKDLDFKDKSSPRVFGTGIVIVIVVIFSSVSFVLGYFVGKVGRDERAEPFVRAADAPVQSKTSNLESAKPESAAQSGLPSSDNQAHEVTAAEQPKEAPGPDSNPHVLPGEPGKGGPKQSSPSRVKEQPAIQKKETSRTDNAAEHASVQASGEVYTVQLGALKKAAEAKRLRAKFEEKGYKTFLLITENRKHEKIYKVRVGEFRKKKEAEILALKLRKTEGLKAFVTVKN
jgi:cell division septation protein DedD